MTLVEQELLLNWMYFLNKMEIRGDVKKVWIEALKSIIKNGRKITSPVRPYREISPLLLVVENLEKVKEPLERLQKFEKWVFPSISEIEESVFKRSELEFEFVLGARLFNFNGAINQIDDYIIPKLKAKLDTRKAVAVVWYPLSDSKISKEFCPAALAFDFKVRGGKLNLITFLRSNDIFFGWPVNIYQFYLLQKYIQTKIRVELGTISTVSTSAHIYEDVLQYAELVIKEFEGQAKHSN